uniref:hypothetical protein n=1 Tax=Sphingomonas sp. CCH9-H8 TaxID=1768772 RepID=UPI000A50E919
ARCAGGCSWSASASGGGWTATASGAGSAMAFADRRRALTGPGDRDGRGWACVRRGAMAMAGRGLAGRAMVGPRWDSRAGRVRVVRVRARDAPAPGGPMADSRVLADRVVALKSGSPAGGPVTGVLEPVGPAAGGLMVGSRAVRVPAMAGPVAAVLAMVGPMVRIRERVSPMAGSPAPGVRVVGDRATAAQAMADRVMGVRVAGGVRR